MKNIFMPGITPNERVEALNKICYNRGDDTFQRTLTQSEIDVEKDNYFKYLKEENTLKEEMKQAVEDYQKRIKAAAKDKEECFEVVNTGQREVRDKLYWVIDEENGKMLKYDRYGELISQRALTPEETNRRLFDNSEIGFDDEANDLPGDVSFDDDDNEVRDIADVDDEIKDVDFEEVTDEDLPEFLESEESQLEETPKDAEETPEPAKKSTRKKKTDN